MEKLTYNWISEEYKPRVCVTTDRPCRIKQCPAWYSRGDGMGRCLLVPGYMLRRGITPFLAVILNSRAREVITN